MLLGVDCIDFSISLVVLKGFIEDEYGPTSFERQKSGMSRSSRRELESRMSLSDSPLYGVSPL